MVREMIPNLEGKDADVRLEAVLYIGNYVRVDEDALKAIPKIGELALGDEDWLVRREAVRVIVRALEAKEGALDGLKVYDDWTGKYYTMREYIMRVSEDALKDVMPAVRSAAARALGFVDESNRDDAIYLLLKALRDVDSDVRRGAALALGRIGDQSVLGELSRLAFDLNEEEMTATDAFCSFRRIIRRMSGSNS
jgi:HEAT repeat protein